MKFDGAVLPSTASAKQKKPCTEAGQSNGRQPAAHSVDVPCRMALHAKFDGDVLPSTASAKQKKPCTEAGQSKGRQPPAHSVDVDVHRLADDVQSTSMPFSVPMLLVAPAPFCLLFSFLMTLRKWDRTPSYVTLFANVPAVLPSWMMPVTTCLLGRL